MSLDGCRITVLAVETKSLDMPDDKQAVYDRMISERNNIAASIPPREFLCPDDKNNTTKEVSVMKSEAKAEGEKIKAGPSICRFFQTPIMIQQSGFITLSVPWTLRRYP